MNTAVLIHGGFHGGWSWRKVADPLRKAGWRVYAPSLTGLADRAHLATPDVTLETHITDITQLIEFEELNDVVLCAHSAAGMVAAAVVDRLPDRIKHVVYLDAMVPVDGQTFFDVIGEETGMPQYLRDQANQFGDGWLVEPGPVFGPEGLGITDQADAEWATRHLTSHPLRAFSDRLALTGAGDHVPTTYVRATQLPIPTLDRLSVDMGAARGWEIRRWDAGHDLMIIESARVIDLLKSIAASDDGRSS